MKKSLLPIYAMAVLALFTASCEEDIKEAAQVRVAMEQSDIVFDIPPVPTAGTELTVTGQPMRYDVDSLIRSNNGQYSFINVKAASIKSCEVEIINQGADHHWGHLQDATASMFSNADANPVAIANVVNNPATEVRVLNLNTTNIDLSPHLNADTFYYSMRLKNRTAFADTLHCRATVRYELTLGL